MLRVFKKLFSRFLNNRQPKSNLPGVVTKCQTPKFSEAENLQERAGIPPNKTLLRKVYKNSKGLNISEWYSKEPTAIPYHRHSRKEWIIVLKGKMGYKTEKTSKIYTAGEYVCVAIGVLHSRVFLEGNTKILCIKVGMKNGE